MSVIIWHSADMNMRMLTPVKCECALVCAVRELSHRLCGFVCLCVCLGAHYIAGIYLASDISHVISAGNYYSFDLFFFVFHVRVSASASMSVTVRTIHFYKQCLMTTIIFVLRYSATPLFLLCACRASVHDDD